MAKNKLISPRERLERYYNFVSTYTYYEQYGDKDDYDDYDVMGVIAEEIARNCQIPLDVVLKDLKVMLRSKASIIEADEEYESSEDDGGFWEDVRDGAIGFFTLNTKRFLSLTREESSIIRKLNKASSVSFDNNNELKIKEAISFKDASDDFVDNIYTVMAAVENGSFIKFEYHDLDSNRKMTIQGVVPLKLLYDSEENMYGVLAVYKKEARIYRIDRITNLSVKSEDIQGAYTDEEVTLINRIPYIWGTQCADDDRVGHVKVAFRNVGKVWNKVKGYVEYRENKKLYEKGDYLFYEDEVYGLESFKNWILGFGSSAVVIEPKFLRDDIIKMMEERIEKLGKEQ